MTAESASDATTALYPFPYQDEADLDAMLAEIRRSTVDKVREITALRARVVERDGEHLAVCARAMARAFEAGGRLFAFGNGGSSADAQYLATLFLNPGRGINPLPAWGLTSDVAVVTALSNDIGFDMVYARQLATFGRCGDIAVGLSTSGNSENVVRAFDEASRLGMLTVGIAGDGGGVMAELGSIDHVFVVPSPSVYRIHEVRTTICHVLWELAVLALRTTRDMAPATARRRFPRSEAP